MQKAQEMFSPRNVDTQSRHAEEQIRKLEAAGSRKDRELDSLRERLEQATQAINDLRHQTKQSTEEAVALRDFLSTYDDLSAADVRSQLETINRKVKDLVQLGVSQWFTLTSGDTRRPTSSHQAGGTVHKAERPQGILADQFWAILQETPPEHVDMSIILEAALQACITAHIKKIFDAFCADFGEQAENAALQKHLSELAKHLYDGGQSVAIQTTLSNTHLPS